MPAECVSSAHSETFHWRRCCILVFEGRQAWEGKAQCPPALDSWPLPFPRASPESPEAVWLISINLLVPGWGTLAWKSSPISHLGSELGFPWCGDLVRLVLLWRGVSVSLGGFSRSKGNLKAFPLHSIAFWFGWRDRDKNSSLLAENVTPFCSITYSLPWVVNLQVARTSCIAVSDRQEYP